LLCIKAIIWQQERLQEPEQLQVQVPERLQVQVPERLQVQVLQLPAPLQVLSLSFFATNDCQ
jgi:hypothetical protein